MGRQLTSFNLKYNGIEVSRLVSLRDTLLPKLMSGELKINELNSKKPDFLKQEIYGNLILYNFGIFLANEAALEKQKQQLEIEQHHQSQNKYHYQVDFSSALRIARKYFWRDSRTEKDIIHLMIKYVHAVKEELRQFSRPLRGIGAVHFAFR